VNKASNEELNSLHGLVAKELSKGLDDPKTLALAIKFLKDNDITADLVESSETKSLTESIMDIAKREANNNNFSVEDMLAVGAN
jgi:hypothetical protein